MKKTISLIMSVLTAILLSLTVYADGLSAVQHFSNEESVMVYVAGKPENSVEVRIAGVLCDAEVIGDVSSTADMFQTLFLIDSSTSMKQYSDIISAFITECIDVKRENEFFSIAEFTADGSPSYLCGFETDRYELTKVTEKIVYDQGRTFIYENLNNALKTIADNKADCYKRVVLFTDGNENSTIGSTINDIFLFENETPIQVHIVSLVNKNKSNAEALKNVEVIARSTNAATIRLESDESVSEAVEILMSDPQKIYAVRIVPASELLDGSKKTVELSFGEEKIVADIRMIMAAKSEMSTAETTMTEAILTESSDAESDTITTDSTNINESPINLFIIIGIALFVLTLIIVVIVMIFNRKKDNINLTSPTDTPTEETETVKIKGSDDNSVSFRSGDTQKLFNTRILLRDVTNADRTFEINVQGEIIVGRSSSATVVVDYDKSISGKHCSLFEKNGKIYVKDLQSSNKTYVNEREAAVPVELHTSDELKIGRTIFKVTIC